MSTSSNESTSVPVASGLPKDTLILYAYHETENARRNAEFFIRHGLHDSADFVFILNGNSTDLDLLLPADAKNIRVVRRENQCYDLGAFGAVLRAMGDTLNQYKRYILLNASIRGPFVPHWSKECWSDAYLGKVTDHVKVMTQDLQMGSNGISVADDWSWQLVGMTMNCNRFGGAIGRHVQSMLLATDRTGLFILLAPASETLTTCPTEMQDAIDTEVRITEKIEAAGYKVDAMMQEFQAEDDFAETCTGDDRNYEGAYDHGIKEGGMNLHPYEMLFFKANRHISEKLVDSLTTWTDQAGYSSYDVCRRPR